MIVDETTSSASSSSALGLGSNSPDHASRLLAESAKSNGVASPSEAELEAAQAAALKMSNVNTMVCLAHSLTSYLVTMPSRASNVKLKNVTVRLYDAVNLWLSRLFRFHDSSVLFHEQECEGLVRMCHMMLNFKFGEFKKSGYLAINKQPLVYISAAAKYAHLDYRELIAIHVTAATTTTTKRNASKLPLSVIFVICI